MKSGSKDFCVVSLYASKHILTLIIPKDMGQKTIIINSMDYKINENFLKEKLQGLSHEYLNKFNLGTLYFKGIEKSGFLGNIATILEELNIPMFVLFNQLNNISYIQYTVQENGSCCVFGSTFAELCAGKKNCKEVCRYLGIGQSNAPILTDAYDSIKTSLPNAVNTIFCQDPNKIEQLTFKNYIPNLGDYLKCLYYNAYTAKPSSDLQYCRAADNMIEIQKADSYYDWMNKKQSKSLNDALKDMKDMTQKQESAIARQ